VTNLKKGWRRRKRTILFLENAHKDMTHFLIG
jgi:hypothetical protein